MLATDFQKLLKIASCEVFAYGYTFERESVWLFFFDGYVVRRQEKYGQKSFYIAYRNFRWDQLTKQVKRWYTGTGSTIFNPQLKELLKACGASPTMTLGGHGYGEKMDVGDFRDWTFVEE